MKKMILEKCLLHFNAVISGININTRYVKC
jgi:hypothetical protein